MTDDGTERATRTVLHVLPHPGGGGERYVDLLSELDGYRARRTYLARNPTDWKTALRRAMALDLRASSTDILHLHGEAAAGLCLPAMLRRPSVVTLHGLNLLRRQTGVRERVVRYLLGAIVRTARTTICISESELADVVAALGARSRSRLDLVVNGVDDPCPSTASKAEARRALGLAEEAFVVLLVGSLDTNKDPLTVARAVADLRRAGRPVTLVVLGEGPLRPALERIAADAGGGIRLEGQKEVRPYLAAADVLAMASRREGLPFVLLEAMAARVPTIAARNPGSAEAVGDAGVLVAPDDSAAFAHAIEKLWEDNARRDEMARRGRERFETHFQADTMRRETRAIYDRVARG